MKKLLSWLEYNLGIIAWIIMVFVIMAIASIATLFKKDRITCMSPLSIYTAENGAQSCLTDKEYSDIISSRFSRVGDDERGVDCYILDQGKANQTMSCMKQEPLKDNQ